MTIGKNPFGCVWETYAFPNDDTILFQHRTKDGWTHGAQRDDEQKHHPCLIPYADLSETEREYDRQFCAFSCDDSCA